MHARRPARAAVGLAAALGALALGGCALHRAADPPRPLIGAPDAWSLPGSPSGTPAADLWWADLGDEPLATLIEQSLASNLSVAQAVERLQRAGARLDQVRTLDQPALDAIADGEVLRERGGGLAKDGQVGLGLVWEIDLFGRLRAAARAAERDLVAAAADLQDARLALSVAVADTWYQAVEQRLQLALLAEQRALAEVLLELTELRFAHGDASAVDVLQQRSQLAEVAAEVPAVLSRLRGFENRLDVLVGTAPDAAPRTELAGVALPAPESLPALGVPSDLLALRPDLRALAERAVAADERIGEAIADRLPRVTLTGALAYGDVAAAGGWAPSLAASLLQPLLDWGRRRAAVEGARAEQREALLAFSEGLLVAIEEVETTLWQETQQRILIDALARRVELLDDTVRGTRWRYAQGITDYLPVLTAVRELQQAQRELLTRRRELVSLRIRLHGALGGALPATVLSTRAAGPAAATP